MKEVQKGNILNFLYKNYKGETSVRSVVVDQLFLGSNQWHPQNQFLLSAFDLDKRAMRCFAVKDMSNITMNINKWGESKSV